MPVRQSLAVVKFLYLVHLLLQHQEQHSTREGNKHDGTFLILGEMQAHASVAVLPELARQDALQRD